MTIETIDPPGTSGYDMSQGEHSAAKVVLKTRLYLLLYDAVGLVSLLKENVLNGGRS